MRKMRWRWSLVLFILSTPLGAQQTAPVAPPITPPSLQLPAQPPPAIVPPKQAVIAPAAAPAATVNGQEIPEVAVQRALKNVPADHRGEARGQIVNFLIENALIDQYLVQLQVNVEPKEVDAKVAQVREAVQKQGSTLEKTLQELMLTEAELRAQIVLQLRWEKFVNAQASDTALHELFDNNHEMFDGTVVRARHILLSPPSGDAKACVDAKTRLAGYKTQIEAQAAKGVAEMPANADAAARRTAHDKQVDTAFAALARKESVCPSKAQDGDLGYFPRCGSMVEPFAKAAFALKPFEISEVVTTQFGYHLILVTDRRPGKETKFDDVKDEVKEVLGDRLRDNLLARLRPNARIVIAAPGR